ncbi:Gfo/Idh/MocA family oxidoreductase [Paenibacillus sp. CC-CFT747]|nr:Gfo/Idh/MocA family oxidoreductase [Paenibacillus sp. CC-CFT747]
MTYRAVVAGGGGIAVRHLEAMQEIEGLVPVAVAEIREERASELASQFRINAYTDYRVMIEKERPDLVIIALPHFLHKEASLFAAAQGCHILLEKPMALTTEECDDIIQAVRESGTILMVGHTQHYIAENLAAKDLVDSGELGELVMIQEVRHVPYDRPDRPGWFFEKSKAGGGILTNLGSHSIDKIQWLTGSPVTRVKASVHHGMNRGDVEGAGMAFLETAAGIPAVMVQSGYQGSPAMKPNL